MKKTITAILAIALMAIPASAIAHIESWAEYDQRLEKQIADVKAKLPIQEDGDSDFMYIADVEKNGKIITTTLVINEDYSSFHKMIEEQGGIEKFKANWQRRMAIEALELHGLQIARNYRLQDRVFVGHKELFTIEVSKIIIMIMLQSDDKSYTPPPLRIYPKKWETDNEGTQSK